MADNLEPVYTSKMTSRRSRLKAVANLPVRRKLLSSQGSTEETVSDNHSAQKIHSSNPKNDDLGAPNSNTCQNVDVSNSVPSKILQVRSNEVNQNVIGSDRNETFNDNISENPDLTGVFHDKSNNYIINLLENNNELSGTCNGNKNGSNCENLLFKCDNNSDFNSPLPGEKSQWQISERCLENHIFEKPTISTSSVNDLANSNIIEDGVKCYAVLSSENIADPSISTITSFTPCITGDMDALNEISAQDISQNFEEVQIYTELVPATEGYDNVPEFVTNDNTEFIIQNEQLESSLTNLVNCNAERVDEDISSNFDHNKTHFKNVVQNTTVKPSVKINTNEGFSGNSVTILGDKTILGNLTSSVLQNSTPESDPMSIPLRKGISTIKRKRSKCNDFTKKLADARREFQKKYDKSKPDRSTLKMIDLIFYNPTSNPMESKSKFDKNEASLLQGELIQEILTEEGVDDPESMDSNYGRTSDNNESDGMSRMPVPQVKIGLNGEIILDEKSLVIETTNARKGREDLQNSIPVFEDRGTKISYYRGKTRKTRDWTDFETKRFYKALNTIGPDFSLMQKYFPKRSRVELKNKFKREERLNRNLIDKALNNPSEFDMTQLEKDLAVEKRAEEEETEMRLYKGPKEKIAPRKARIKSSFLSRELNQVIESDGETENCQSKPDCVTSKRIPQSEKEKKKKEISLLFQKILLKGSGNEISEFEGVSESSLDVFTTANDGVT